MKTLSFILRLPLFFAAKVSQINIHPRVQECQLAQAVFQRIEIEFNMGESFGRRQECHFRAGNPASVFRHPAAEYYW